MKDLTGEHCVLCGAGAAVRVSGTSFCAPCGLEQYSTGNINQVARPARKRRAALLSLLSSGFLVKMLLGAVAVAAVGGVAVTTVGNSDRPSVEAEVAYAVPETMAPTTTAATTTTDFDLVAAGVESTVTTSTAALQVAASQAAAAHEYAAAVQAWAECVSTAAAEHSGGRFDPESVCDKPEMPDFGLTIDGPPGQDPDGPGNSENAPGRGDDGPGNSENAPGRGDDGPGNSENAPGQADDGPGNSENAPGQSGEDAGEDADRDNADKDKDKDKDEG